VGKISGFSGENLFNVLIASDVTDMQEHLVSLSTTNAFNILPYVSCLFYVWSN